MKLIILAAGRGTRMQNSLIHKGLLPFKGKAVISHAIDAFPSVDIIMAIHHQADQLKQFIQHAHADRRVSFLDVGSLDERRAGPGLSLLKALKLAESPALITTSDSYIELPVTARFDRNWLGVGKVPFSEHLSYCNVLLDSNQLVVDIKDKQLATEKYLAWTGTMFLHDWSRAVDNLESELKNDGGELQCSAAWGQLSFCGVEHIWVDTGTKERYESAIKHQGFDYSKPDEQTYIQSDRVIKFFSDKSRASARHARQQEELSDITPKELLKTDNFISYAFAKGDTFYRVGTPNLLKALLQQMQSELWSAWRYPQSYEAVENFYKEKTLTRTEAYLKSSTLDFSKINGVQLKWSWPELLNLIDFSSLCSDARIAPFHGDFQFDNIIVDESRFTLIDWRDRFIDSNFGDVYYELGKLLSGITFDFDLVKLNSFNIIEEHGEATISFARRTTNAAYEKILDDFSAFHGYDFDRIRVFRWLNIASMSGVHKEPYSTALYYFSLAEMHQEKSLLKFLR